MPRKPCSLNKGFRFTRVILASLLLGLCLDVLAAEPDYYARFEQVLKSGHGGFVEDASLINTNTPIPISTYTPVSLSALMSRGELCGVRLGMTMSDVVRIWGKPNALYTFCIIGPRFWYTDSGNFTGSGVTLFFVSNKLEVINFYSKKMNNWRFEKNGLSGLIDKKAARSALDPPMEHPPEVRINFGDMVYCEGNIRTDFGFSLVRRSAFEEPRDILGAVSVRFADGPTIIPAVKPLVPANSSQLTNAITNRPTSTDGPGQ
jgi:hypothetical protein